MPNAPDKVLVVKPCCIGDAVMALPAIEALAGLARHGKAHLAVGNHSRAVLEAQPSVEQVIKIRDVPGLRDAMNLTRKFREFDSVAVLDRSRLLHAAARAAPRRATIRDLEVTDIQHETDIYLDVARLLGARPQSSIPWLHFSEAVRREASFVLEHMPAAYITIHPGGGVNPGSSLADKRWPIERYHEVAQWADGRGLATVVTGGPGDKSLASELVAMSEPSDVTSIVGQLSLMASAYVASRGVAFVGGDTGMSHLAAASGVPTVALFGPTNPGRYAPRGARVRVLAPEASFRLPDRDLRKASELVDEVSTARIMVDEVLETLETLIDRPAMR